MGIDFKEKPQISDENYKKNFDKIDWSGVNKKDSSQEEAKIEKSESDKE